MNTFPCGDHPAPRRDFIKAAGFGAAGVFFARLPVMAGPFTREDFGQLVPEDKKLSDAWIQSLFQRGTPEVWTGGQLKYVGLPIGGIGAGQLYLGGNGKLWHWDIFNIHAENVWPEPQKHYAKPMLPASPVEHGFVLDGTPLENFPSISFRGEYPFGIVEYREKEVTVTLEAFSPFIPLNTDDSSLPATVMRFTVKNTGTAARGMELTGHLAKAGMTSRVVGGKGFAFLECASADPKQAAPDSGTMGLALLGEGDALRRKFSLAPGQSEVITFVLTWHFPNLDMPKLPEKYEQVKLPGGRYYATKFASALAVAEYVAGHFARLHRETKLWRDTWYDSTLPYWFLDRTMLNTSILASSTCYRFKDGRFYAWEGVGCCAGTCTHVWHYAHAMARLFPDLERDTRERVDFGIALQPDGGIRFRGEVNALPAVDGQAGTILRALREHQMTADNAFLKKNWPNIKRATQWLIQKDADGDGLITGNQHNTLDTDWFGPVAWISGLYVAALEAAAVMADAVEDAGFARQCREISARGQKNITAQLFDGEYYINKVDANHLAAVNSGTGCEIDQVMGQSWAWQVGLPRVFPEKETKSALRSLWKYNFTPDVGPYRQKYKPGRWYAMAGEAGLLMCTFPRKDWDFPQARGKGGGEWAAMYFNECMNGFEYQAAGHMIWEGMLLEGLAVTRAVHERYAPHRRNPYNEVECGDHYARSMASYGVYLAACGFEYDGPKAHIGFSPRLAPENFKAAFTGAEGWGTFRQRVEAGGQRSAIEVKYGRLQVKTVALATTMKSVAMRVNGQPVNATTQVEEGRLLITLSTPATLEEGQTLEISVTGGVARTTQYP